MEHQQISLIGKVTSVLEEEELVKKSTGKVLRKCDFIIADATASCRGMVWEHNLNMLKEDTSYKIFNATVRSFNGAKYLSLSERAIIKAVDDIGDTADDMGFDGSGGISVVQGEIIAAKTEVYLSCRCCSSKVMEVGDIVQCAKCRVKVKTSRCSSKHIARVLLVDANDKEYKATIFDKIVKQVLRFCDAASGDIDDKLLNSPVLRYSIKDEIVISVAKVVDNEQN